VAEVARYYACKIPEFVVLILPIALLLALLYSLTNHARHNELTAIRAAGVGVMRLSASYLVVGLLFSICIFAVNESWVPKANQRAEAIVSVGKSGGSGGQTRWAYNLSFRNARDGRIWTIGAYNLDTFEMRKPQIEWRLPMAAGARSSRRMPCQDGIWVFNEVLELTYPSPVTTNALLLTNVGASDANERLERAGFSETPEQIRARSESALEQRNRGQGSQLSLAEIVNFLHLHRIWRRAISSTACFIRNCTGGWPRLGRRLWLCSSPFLWRGLEAEERSSGLPAASLLRSVIS
jgi:lipopolysaccharide export LptBFGC system permease protein LptF